MNITPLTNQQYFDNALLGVRAQGYEPSTQEGNCRYRGDEGRKCGAGFSIPDSVYDPDMEGKRIDDVICEWEKVRVLLDYVNQILVRRVQGIHDSLVDYSPTERPVYFEFEMRNEAEAMNLIYTPPEVEHGQAT